MFWGRTSSTTAAADATGAGNAVQSTSSRSTGFFAALDILSASESRVPFPNQSAGENAREELAQHSTTQNSVEEDEDLGIVPSSSFTLSEQRRLELLQAARANRTTWIDGATASGEETSRKMPWQPHDQLPKVPIQCQIAIDQIALELRSLLARLEEMKRKIIPNDMVYSSESTTSDDDNQQSHEYITIADELRAKQNELESWRRIHVGDGRVSAMQRKRMTASDKEMLFLLAYQELLAVLRHPMAAELVYQIQVFVNKFEHWNLEAMLRQRAVAERPGGHVQSFINKLVLQIQRTTGADLFASLHLQILSLDDDEDELLLEVLEAFLMEKLYKKALTPSTKAEAEDEQLRERLESLSFVEYRHLDLPAPATPQIQEQWSQLTEQLRLLSAFPSPRRKMDCVLRVCQQLTALLSSLHPKGKFPSADEFLPGLIYLLLKANPSQLKRNVHLILEYRRPSRLVSEPGYFFTHLVSSVAFLEQVNGDLLTITPEEFDHGLQRSKHRVVETTQQQHQQQQQTMEAKLVAVELLEPIFECVKLPTVLEIRARRLAALNRTVGA